MQTLTDNEQLSNIARRKRAADEAIRLFESHPDFARAQVRMRERMAEAERTAPREANFFGTRERMEFVLSRLDIRAETFLELSSDIKAQNAFMAILGSLEGYASQEFTGCPGVVRPVGAESQAQLEAIHAKVQQWTTEGYKRLALLKAQPQPPAEAASSPEEETPSPAEAKSTVSDPPRQNRQSRYPRSRLQPIRWEDIDMRICSDERVRIHVGEEFETFNFAGLGLDDRRTGNANRTWEALLRLAASDGIIRSGEGKETWNKIEKRMQATRKFLRYFFNLPGEPLKFVEKHGYQARFRIRLEPAYRT